MRNLLLGAAVAMTAASLSCGALAQKSDAGQKYPSRPIRFICPYVPGGAGDIFTRSGRRRAPCAAQQVPLRANDDGCDGANGKRAPRPPEMFAKQQRPPGRFGELGPLPCPQQGPHQRQTKGRGDAERDAGVRKEIDQARTAIKGAPRRK